MKEIIEKWINQFPPALKDAAVKPDLYITGSELMLWKGHHRGCNIYFIR
jgi:hypothetical protein